MAIVATGGVNRSQDPGFGFLTWVTGAQGLQPSSIGSKLEWPGLEPALEYGTPISQKASVPQCQFKKK